MTPAARVVFRLRRFWNETRAQDLIEYALMAGFVATAAGAIMPGISSNISAIFSKVASTLGDASRTPSG